MDLSLGKRQLLVTYNVDSWPATSFFLPYGPQTGCSVWPWANSETQRGIMASDDLPITEDIFFPCRRKPMPSLAVTDNRRLEASKKA